MKLLNEELSEQLKGIFKDMPNEITIATFIKEGTCNTCEETVSFMSEIEELSDKILFSNYTLENNQDLIEKYNIEMFPSIVLLDSKGEYHGVKFNGIPAGHEFNAFIPAILETAGKEEELPKEIAERINKIDKPVNIKVFVTLSCPHCSGAVQKAHKIAMMNERVDAEMIEAQTFGEISQKFNVSGVPKIVINDQYELVGNQPLEEFLNEIEKI